MAKDFMSLTARVDTALRGVLRDVLADIAEHGMPGRHHFYISFRTDIPGAVLPIHLRQRYPEEMTIVLQHQFWNLEIKEQGFEVTLSFNNVPEYLFVPFAAVSAFADPSVPFGLRFTPHSAPSFSGRVPPASSGQAEATIPAAAPPKPDSGGEVVPLDQFRNKK